MKRLLFVLFLALLYFVYDLLYSAGYFETIISHFDGQQTKIYTSAPGTEDIDLDEELGCIYVSSTDRRDSKANGAIYRIQADSAGHMIELWNDYKSGFRPHGISYIKDKNRAFLFVINHNRQGDFVEKFEIKNDSLFHLNTYVSDLMFSPNDLVAIDQNSFYVTNDHGYKKGTLLRTLEDYLRLPKSYVLYFDGKEFSIVIEGQRYANGINVSNDGRKLYVSQTTGQELSTYSILETGNVELIDVLPIKSGLDNIEVAKDGRIWIGSHPKMLDFVAHAKDASNISPSQVFVVEFIDGNNASVKEVFLDDGSIISGSSVAVPYKNDIFIGAVFDWKVFRGRLWENN